MYLPDINFWLALALDKHPHHSPALAWLNALSGKRQCCFCRYTQLGYLRLATNPKSTPLQTLTLSKAWTAYDDLARDPNVGFLAEPAGLDLHWRQFTQGATYSHHVWNDAYLAAFAIASGAEVVTF